MEYFCAISRMVKKRQSALMHEFVCPSCSFGNIYKKEWALQKRSIEDTWKRQLHFDECHCIEHTLHKIVKLIILKNKKHDGLIAETRQHLRWKPFIYRYYQRYQSYTKLTRRNCKFDWKIPSRINQKNQNGN